MHARSLLAVEIGIVRQDDVAMKSSVKAVLAVDVGGNSVKILATRQSERRSFSSNPTLTPMRMVSEVKKLIFPARYLMRGDVVRRKNSSAGSAMITLKEALSDAQRRRIAIGHFNVSDLFGLKAVTSAAHTLNVPVLVGTSEGERNFLGVREIVALVTSLRQQLEHPIFLNADHTHSLERTVEAAHAGYDMIGFDASTMPLEKNIGLTKQAVEAAKSINGELGFIGSGSEIHESVPESSRLLTKTDDAQCFVEATKIDVLAPAV